MRLEIVIGSIDNGCLIALNNASDTNADWAFRTLFLSMNTKIPKDDIETFEKVTLELVIHQLIL